MDVLLLRVCMIPRRCMKRWTLLHDHSFAFGAFELLPVSATSDMFASGCSSVLLGKNFKGSRAVLTCLRAAVLGSHRSNWSRKACSSELNKVRMAGSSMTAGQQTKSLSQLAFGQSSLGNGKEHLLPRSAQGRTERGNKSADRNVREEEDDTHSRSLQARAG